jgi:hypothetical protein
MQANVRVKAKEDVDKQKEKERKREQKELRKIAAANGIKMAKTPSTLATVPVPESGSLATGAGMSMDIDGSPVAEQPKTGGGWASLSASQGSQGGFKKSGWATVGPSSSNSLTRLTSAVDRQPSSALTTSPNITSHHNPTFRNAGWSSLDTGSSQPIPVTYQTSDTSSSSHGGSLRDISGSSQRWQSLPPPPEPGALQSLPPMPPLPPNNP